MSGICAGGTAGARGSRGGAGSPRGPARARSRARSGLAACMPRPAPGCRGPRGPGRLTKQPPFFAECERHREAAGLEPKTVLRARLSGMAATAGRTIDAGRAGRRDGGSGAGAVRAQPVGWEGRAGGRAEGARRRCRYRKAGRGQPPPAQPRGGGRGREAARRGPGPVSGPAERPGEPDASPRAARFPTGRRPRRAPPESPETPRPDYQRREATLPRIPAQRTIRCPQCSSK